MGFVKEFEWNRFIRVMGAIAISRVMQVVIKYMKSYTAVLPVTPTVYVQARSCLSV